MTHFDFTPLFGYTSCGDPSGCQKVATGYVEIKRRGRVVEKITACPDHGGNGWFMFNLTADEIKRGDTARTADGTMAYVVQQDAEIVTDLGTRYVRAPVRWNDGGIEYRYWDIGTRVTMARSYFAGTPAEDRAQA